MTNLSELKNSLTIVEQTFQYLNRNLQNKYPFRQDDTFKYILNKSLQQEYLEKHYKFYSNEENWRVTADFQENEKNQLFLKDFNHYNRITLQNYIKQRYRFSLIVEQPSILTRNQDYEYKKLRHLIQLNLEELHQLLKQ